MGSATDCKRSCTDNAECMSFSLCPRWNGCWLKDRSVTGAEATHSKDDCKTYKRGNASSNVSPIVAKMKLMRSILAGLRTNLNSKLDVLEDLVEPAETAEQGPRRLLLSGRSLRGS